MKDDNIVGWFSLDNGAHVPIKKGESKREATSKFLNKKVSRVQRNKEKYDKIDAFKKRKATNKMNNDDDIEYLDLEEKDNSQGEQNKRKNPNKKITRLEYRDGSYIPIREGEETEREKGVDEKREEFYENVAKYYQKEYETRHNDVESYFGADEELTKELRAKLDPKAEKSIDITKDDVKEVIENFKKRKASNKATPTFTGTDKEKLEQEKKYLDKEIQDLESGNTFLVRDTMRGDNYMMGVKNFMSSQDLQRYNQMKERRNEILRKLKSY